MNKVYLIPAEIKESPKEHLNSLFLNKLNVLTFLTSEEDIWKSAQWFGAKPQHLYFTNGPVKANDWYIFNNQVDEVKIGQATDTNTWRGENSPFYEKIVATTNKEIQQRSEIDLPFIIDYINNYNKGNVIKEVENKLYTRLEFYSAVLYTSELFCTNHEKLGSMTKPEFDEWFNEMFPINFKF